MDAARRKRQRRLLAGYDAQSVAAAARDRQRRRDPLPPPSVLADLDFLAGSVARGWLKVELDAGAEPWGFGVVYDTRYEHRQLIPGLLALGYRAYDRVTARAAVTPSRSRGTAGSA